MNTGRRVINMRSNLAKYVGKTHRNNLAEIVALSLDLRDVMSIKGGSPKRKGTKMEQEFTTVESWKLEAQPVTISDLAFAADWLGQYETDDEETAQQLTNAIDYLMKHIASKQRRTAINQMKREYADQNGVKFSQVKIQKKVGVK